MSNNDDEFKISKEEIIPLWLELSAKTYLDESGRYEKPMSIVSADDVLNVSSLPLNEDDQPIMTTEERKLENKALVAEFIGRLTLMRNKAFLWGDAHCKDILKRDDCQSVAQVTGQCAYNPDTYKCNTATFGAVDVFLTIVDARYTNFREELLRQIQDNVSEYAWLFPLTFRVHSSERERALMKVVQSGINAQDAVGWSGAIDKYYQILIKTSHEQYRQVRDEVQSLRREYHGIAGEQASSAWLWQKVVSAWPLGTSVSGSAVKQADALAHHKELVDGLLGEARTVIRRNGRIMKNNFAVLADAGFKLRMQNKYRVASMEAIDAHNRTMIPHLHSIQRAFDIIDDVMDAHINELNSLRAPLLRLTKESLNTLADVRRFFVKRLYEAQWITTNESLSESFVDASVALQGWETTKKVAIDKISIISRPYFQMLMDFNQQFDQRLIYDEVTDYALDLSVSYGKKSDAQLQEFPSVQAWYPLEDDMRFEDDDDDDDGDNSAGSNNNGNNNVNSNKNQQFPHVANVVPYAKPVAITNATFAGTILPLSPPPPSLNQWKSGQRFHDAHHVRSVSSNSNTSSMGSAMSRSSSLSSQNFGSNFAAANSNSVFSGRSTPNRQTPPPMPANYLRRSPPPVPAGYLKQSPTLQPPPIPIAYSPKSPQPLPPSVRNILEARSRLQAERVHHDD